MRPGIRLPDSSKLVINWKNEIDVTICWHDVIVKLFWGCFVSIIKFNFWSEFYVSIITGSGVKAIFLYKGLTEIRKSEIPPSEFCPISEDWRQLEMPNLVRMSLMKCYWMLLNARVTAFIVSELLREKTPLKLGLREQVSYKYRALSEKKKILIYKNMSEENKGKLKRS